MRPQSKVDVKLIGDAASLTPRQVALLLLLVAGGLLVVGQLYVTIPLVGDIAGRFAVEQGVAAFAGSVFGLAYAVGVLVLGPLSDRHGRRRLILFGLVATAAATLLVGMARGFELLLAARAVQGFVAAAFPPAALSLIAEEFPPRHRPLGVSLMSFSFLGAAPLAQFLAVQAGGDLSAIMLRLVPLYLVVAVGLALLTGTGNAAGARGGAATGGGRLASLLRDRGILAAWGAAITVLFGFVSFHAGAQALAPALGVDLQSLRLASLPPLVLTLAAAPLTRRYGASITARVGLVLAALALDIAVIGSPSAVLAASALLSGGIALAVPGLIATVAGRADNDNRGLALAIYTFVLFVGASLAPPVAQALAGIGIAPLWLPPATLLLAAALGLTMAGRSPAPRRG